jgi:GH25 family lysozyme M1 (1,4-beta-N-acetylmuramidase)
MAAKKRKRRKKQKTYPIIGLLFALLLLLALPLVLMKLGNRQLLPYINPYRPEDFAFENGFMTCLSADSSLGIDVSYYQGEIDWQQVRDAGVEFAFVRLGYRRSTDGVLGEDTMAKRNLQGASDVGIKVGAYFFSQATSAEEAREEAEFALEILQQFPLDLPVSYDWEMVEDSVRTETMTRQIMTDCMDAFCGIIEKAGYDSMVYFNRDLSKTLLDIRQLKDRQVWFAMYDTYPDAPCKPDYWQYTDQGTVPGIEGDVDLNLYLPAGNSHLGG